ncbi:MAG: acyltransferase [Clostridia bacterium]|nr:acyltransferase [Clostridia bacterium]
MDGIKSGQEKTRNTFVDLMRGVAILLVVLGHTMHGSVSGAEGTFVYNLIWSLQMPLFMLISGYITRYGRPIRSAEDLGRFLLKRTVSYLLPWTVWTFAVRGLLLGNTDAVFDLEKLFWHMDTGYWFLISIWIICVIWAVSQFVSAKIAGEGKPVFRIAFAGLFYCVGMGLLAVVGWQTGFSFLTIKQTLYYMPFFFAGYLYGQVRDWLALRRFGWTVIQAAVAISTVAWLVILSRVNLYEIPDTAVYIVIRAAASMAGCIAVCGLGKGLFDQQNSRFAALFQRPLRWAGVHSLEIYLAHYPFLYMLSSGSLPDPGSFKGFCAVLTNYLLTLTVMSVLIILLSQNGFLRFALFGKKKSTIAGKNVAG